MEDHGYLHYALILLLATVIAVPLAKRWRLGAVLGYLGAGLLIGPSGMSLVGNSALIAQISELGIVLMLFVIGLELSPQRLWVMRRHVFGAGTLQMVLTSLALGAIAVALGLDWKAALVVGLGLAISSTAIDLQLLAERKELASPHGRLGFAILLFQDVAAIPLLALVPILGTHGDVHGSDALLSALRAVVIIALVIVGGRYLLRPMFRAAAQQTGTPEIFTATALLVVIGIGLLMELAGLSITLGAFLAGVLLADSEYRHEIEAQIDPFRGLLLGLFFVSIGMSLDLRSTLDQPRLVGLLLLALLLTKGVVMYLIARLAARLQASQALTLSALMAQGGEFAFVVFGLAAGNGLIDAAQRDLAVIVITLSMAATPLLVRLTGEIVPRTSEAKPAREFDAIDAAVPRVIIGGMGRVGQIVARVLNANHIAFTALEADAEQVEFMRRFGNTVYFGDASRLDLLRAAQADRAEIFIITTGDIDTNLRTARLLKRHFPQLKVFARARNRQHVFKLMDLGVDGIVRETFLSSLEVARNVLQALGMDADTAASRVARFRSHDEQLLAEQYLVHDDAAALLQSAQEAREELKLLFQADTDEEADAHGDIR
ncbi:monovalent cation:proton antiporter-2 (CPA2) family protein [Dokdonella sp.]|uniref:monovalent cation:proton antiporter-2 (CPA2) family protein n=1 Tax=Dokdonella sp. TaxID=2291710 RepID=UPI0025C39EC5|nr:monovalent cation:proton antiporter-2 (CPA2) family protein [Dokdonella sp.]